MYSSIEEQFFVLKPLDDQILEINKELKADFHNFDGIRTHIDIILQGQRVVFTWYKENLLVLVNQYMRKYGRPLPLEAGKKILRHIAVALKQLHDKGWTHMGRISRILLEYPPLETPGGWSATDLKPDNVLVDFFDDGTGHLTIKKVAIADLDLAWKREGNELYRGPVVGNVLWRSPEAQAGQGVGQFSDVFSFGSIVSEIKPRARWWQ